MALFDAYKKKSTLNAAIKQTAKARASEGAKAEQLYASVYQGLADVVKGDLIMGEALYNWGFALLHQAMEKEEEQGVKLYLDAISKFTFCLLVEPNHLGAAIDGGVAYMDLARILEVDGRDELYDLAGEFFDNAERIQRGSAAYNLACIYGLRQQQDACLEALQLSKECGSLPNVEAMIGDLDMQKVKNTPWFVEFIEKIVTPEPEVIDEKEVNYNAEGDVVNKNKKRTKYQNEVDGVVYDAEGNVISEEGQEEPEITGAKEQVNTSNSGETSEKSTEETKDKTT